MNSQQQEIEIDIKQAKRAVALYKALDRLHENKDFQEIILNEFFVNESVRAVSMKSEPNAQSEEVQLQVDHVILAIGGLKQFFSKVYQTGASAQNAMEGLHETQQEILEEELGSNVIQ
jgi:hypothetical protein